MWVFYLISLPLTMGMVGVTLWYFAGPDVPRYVRYTVGYTWFCSLSIIILVPADIWTTLSNHDKGQISFFWSWSYWSTFLLTWVVVPIIQGYEDAGDFTITERLKTSAHANLVYYLCVGAIGLFGLLLLIIVQEYRIGNIPGFAMACSNTFGLVTGAFLLGFGLSEIPKGIWRSADWTTHQKILSHKVAKMAVKLDDAHQEFSNAIVVAQATSKQMSKRDPLRPYMNVIDKMLIQMLSEDPSFKPQGGNLGENDMDYDTDAKTMAALRRQLKIAREKYYRYKSEYMNFVTQALELEDTIKNFEHRSGTGWKYISSFRPERGGSLGSMLDKIELIWRCVLAKQLQKFLAILLGCISASILLAEATILPSGVDLSLFSILINATKEHEMLVQVAAFIPLMYMCLCTYYSLFKIGMLTFYSLTPRQTSSVSLLMICSMVARYAPPISYNFLNLIHLDNRAKTIFEKLQETKPSTGLREDDNVSHSKPLKGEAQYENSKEGISGKYKAKRARQMKRGNSISSNEKSRDRPLSSRDESSMMDMQVQPSRSLSSTWRSMKTGFSNFKSNMESKGFVPLHQVQDAGHSRASSTESLDEIFEKIKRPGSESTNYDSDDDVYEMSLKSSRPRR
ncbi:PREDICTED: LMBR1 domain-containing protein 2 homolog A isoform X2 [Nicotiana attenuata]|uniref:LMBR1 domain-containing protein 2 homolog A isoform X2 n=1 Tax=Nicotiana attenuata TaxID=49451 RepID=UPI000905532C|nr:PREDICTED: LMBR1 domain-containing protein 2 homolog A isoform X2 [Nicotiana attenuata]